MGAIAEAIVAYARPLIDQTDGSVEQMENAFAISQLCFNLALLPDDAREQGSTRCDQPSRWMTRSSFHFSAGSSIP